MPAHQGLIESGSVAGLLSTGWRGLWWLVQLVERGRLC